MATTDGKAPSGPQSRLPRILFWFFAAALPLGQTAALAAPAEQADRAGREVRIDPGESDAGTWLSPAAALESARAGQITLLPPTAVTLGELAAHETVTGILAQRRVMTPRLPKVMVTEHEAWLALP